MKSLLLQAAAECGLQDSTSLEQALDRALEANRSLVDAALDTELVEEAPFLEGISKRVGMEWNAHVRPESDEVPALKRICSAQLGVRHRFVPRCLHPGFDPEQPKIELVTYDPFALQQRQAARRAISNPIRWSMAPRRLVLEALRDFYGVGADTFEELLHGRDPDEADFQRQGEVNVLDDTDDEAASVVKFVNQIVREALHQRATDIHVEPLEDDLRIRYRIDGQLRNASVPENIKALQHSVIARIKVMARLDIAEKRLPQDGRISLQLDGKPIDVRVATIPSVTGESASLRLLGQERFSIARLGFLPKMEAEIRELLTHPNGIILVTGPTGSGKSTTLYGFLSELNTGNTLRIVTVEDPVENKLDGAIQIAVQPEIGLTFATGLRSILRGDPNVIMVGEMRDLETAEIAIRAALTGHLVLSTLHTNDAIGGITRLIDMGVEPFLVASSVRAFMAQRLVRQLCSRCRILGGVSPVLLRSSGFPEDSASRIYRANPSGCEHCRYSGFYGRLAIYELCRVTEPLADNIARGLQAQELRQSAISEGFRPMRTYGWEKILQGLTTVEEVTSVTVG